MKTEDKDFLKTTITFGIVLKAEVSKIQEIKEVLADFEDVTVIFQKTSGGKLYIREEGGK